MRYLSFLILPLLLISLGCSQEKQEKMDMQADHQMEDMKQSAMTDTDTMQMVSDTGEKIIYYTCPMEDHKHVHSDKPGKCHECGMALVAAVLTTEDKADFYGCPMEAHSYVRTDISGKCPQCGMELKLMRLKKMEKM
jgi:hypothetical protein